MICHFSSSIEMQFKKKKEEMLFQGKQLSLKKCGLKLQVEPPEALGQKDPNSEFYLSPVLHHRQAEAMDHSGGSRACDRVRRADQGPPRSQSPKPTFSRVRFVGGQPGICQDSCFSYQNCHCSLLGLNSLSSKQLSEPQKPKEAPGVGETPFLSEQMKTARGPHPVLLPFPGSPKEKSYQS